MLPNGPCNFNLDSGQRIGLGMTVGTGFISALAILWLLSLVARNFICNYRKPQPGFKLLRTHIDVYFVSLILSDLIQSIGAMVNLKWVIEGHTYCSHHCTAQGALKEIGEAGVALSTLAIALHTFLAIFFQWVPPRTRWIPAAITTLIWGFLLIFMAVNVARHPWYPGSSTTNPYYAPSPFWCWVSKTYTTQRIVGEYGWLWACAFVSIILYIPLYFCLRGNIVADPQCWYRISFHRRQTISTETYVTGMTSRKEATKMLVYPIVYTILVLPLSIGRWATYGSPSSDLDGARTDGDVSSAKNGAHLALLIGIPIFGLSGLVNVVSFMVTRPKLLSLNSTETRSTSTPYGNGHTNFRSPMTPLSSRPNQISFYRYGDDSNENVASFGAKSQVESLTISETPHISKGKEAMSPLSPSSATILSTDQRQFAAFRHDLAQRRSDFELMAVVERNRSPRPISDEVEGVDGNHVTTSGDIGLMRLSGRGMEEALDEMEGMGVPPTPSFGYNQEEDRRSEDLEDRSALASRVSPRLVNVHVTVERRYM